MTSEALATILADPERADSVPRDEIPKIMGQIERLRMQLWLRLSTLEPNGKTSERATEPAAEKLLNAEEVAEILGTDTRYIYRHADDWPFTRRLSKGTLRFSESGLRAWIDRSRP